MKIKLFTLGLDLTEQENVKPTITFNEDLLQFTNEETLKNILTEDEITQLTTIGVKIINKIKGFE